MSSSSTQPKVASFLCKFSKPNGEFTMNGLVSGTITIIPELDIQYKNIYYKIYWEIEPLRAAKKVQVVTARQDLAKSYGFWKKGQPVLYNFDFKPVAPLSFKGSYFDIHWYIEVEVELTQSSVEKLRKQSMNKLHWLGMVFPRRKVAFRFPFTVRRGTRAFKVGATYKHEDYSSAMAPYYIGSGIGLLGIVLGWQAWLNFALPIFEIIGSSALGIGAYQMFVGFGKLEHVYFNVKPLANNNFELEIDVKKNWRSIEKLEIAYTVNQEISYDENDSNSSSAQIIEMYRYKSPQVYKIKEAITQIQLPLPQSRTDLPTSLSNDPYTIFWELEITLVLTSGRKKTVKQVFFVTI